MSLNPSLRPLFGEDGLVAWAIRGLRGSPLARALALVALLVSPALAGDFFLDDLHNLERALSVPWTPSGLSQGFTFLDDDIVRLWNLPHNSPIPYFRPLVALSLKIDHALWGLHSSGYHLSNLLLHLTCVALVYLIAARLAGKETAGFAAFLFGIFPHGAVAPLWISGRTELLGGLFAFAALLFHLRFLEEKKARFVFGVLLASLGACLSKETAVAIPALIGIHDLLRARDRILRLIPYYALVGLFFAGYLAWRFYFFGHFMAPPPPYFHDPLKADFLPFFVAKSLYYAFCSLTTLPVVPVFAERLLLAKPALFLLLAAFTLPAFWFLLRRYRNTAGFTVGLALAFGATLPVAAITAIDLYLYMAGAGLAIAAAAALRTEKARAPASPWPKRLSIGLATVWVLGVGAKLLFYDLEPMRTSKLAKDVLAMAGGEFPPDSRLYLLNIPFSASHVAPELRLSGKAPGLKATLLALSPDPFGPDLPPETTWLDAQTLSVRAPAGKAFFETPTEQALMLFDKPVEPGRRYDAVGLSVVPISDQGAIRELRVRFDAPLKSPSGVYVASPGWRWGVKRIDPPPAGIATSAP